MSESVVSMTSQPLLDAQRAAPYRGRKLRQILSVPLEALTDDYLREQHLIVEAVFPPMPGLVLDKPVNNNALIVVIRKGCRNEPQ